ncbi:glycosyltransferase [Actinotignum urinale]|uniref:glycosyltransferase n=1 Tax=Actinotignum urinale TaxID=190146 RepID=UPI00370D9BB0
MSEKTLHSISVVIPVYQGASTLPALFAELEQLTGVNTSPHSNTWTIDEVICVYDHGHDNSPEVLRELSLRYPWLKVVWLSRNFGQHAATLAGITQSTGQWVVTIDEDGQQNPFDIGILLDQAINETATLVYAKPLNEPPHGFVRNIASRGAKKVVDFLLNTKDSVNYNSFRLILGEIARAAAKTAGNGVYMDVALGWISTVSVAGVNLRDEGDHKSGYTFRSLFAHFKRMVVSSGTQSLRIVSFFGWFTAILGFVMAIVVFVNKMVHPATAIGWSSTIITILVTSGLILISLGVIAEYLGASVSMAMGRPLFVILSHPNDYLRENRPAIIGGTKEDVSPHTTIE